METNDVSATTMDASAEGKESAPALARTQQTLDVALVKRRASAQEPSTSRAKRTEWVERWRDVIATEPELPGVWRRQAGGFHVHARTLDPRTGKMREVNWALPNVTKARDAFAWLQAELEKIRAGTVASQPSVSPQFRNYANDVFQRKLDLGKVR